MSWIDTQCAQRKTRYSIKEGKKEKSNEEQDKQRGREIDREGGRRRKRLEGEEGK